MSIYNITQRRLRRTLLDEGMKHGVPEPEELVQDVLIKGDAHHIFAASGEGKSMFALWCVKRALERDVPAVYMDMENGQRIITDRLKKLGVTCADELLHYYDFPSLDMSEETRAEYLELLESMEPGLLVFDAWVGFLTAAGLNEDSNTDVELWSIPYITEAKALGWTIALLDHVGHADKTRHRGAMRKKDFVGVQWQLNKREDFGRDSIGSIRLTQRKDRQSWLPSIVEFAIGGTQEGIVVKKTEVKGGNRPWLAPSVFDALKLLLPGMKWSQWRDRCVQQGMVENTFKSAVPKLKDGEFVRLDEDKHYWRTRLGDEQVGGGEDVAEVA